MYKMYYVALLDLWIFEYFMEIIYKLLWLQFNELTIIEVWDMDKLKLYGSYIYEHKAPTND